MPSRPSNPDGEGPANPPAVGAAFLVSQVGAHAAVRFGERLAEVRLKPHHAGILRMLGSNPSLSQQALSDLLGIFPSQLVRLLDELEARQLIERRPSPRDRRTYRLHLTGGGRRTLTEIGRLTRELEEDLFAGLTEPELGLLRAMLGKVVAQQGITPGVHPAYKQLGRQAKT
jgi:DNA-binding MarR family transcriptional regulator